MNDQPQPFTFAPAVRDYVPLLIGIAGASGSGKTLSALKIARGLVGGDDNKIAFIDTEAGRGKHYAVGPGEKPGPNRFAFMHGDLHPPFSPQRYMAAIDAADKAGFGVILIDSYSHSWEGDGGLHDMHDENVRKAVEKARHWAEKDGKRFDEEAAAERANIGAWRQPKAENKKLVTHLLQTRAHLIVCLRADEKMRMEQIKDERTGRTKTVIVQAKDMPPNERWTPICEKRFMYELTLSLILTPQAPGIPVPVKLQEQHRAAVPLDKQLSEETGRLLAEWARGGHPNAPSVSHSQGASGGSGLSASPQPVSPLVADVGRDPQSPGTPAASILDDARTEAKRGKRAFMKWFRGLNDDEQARVDAITDEIREIYRDRP